MTQYLDIDIDCNRMWRLTVVMHDIEQEYILPEERLGGLVASVACEPRVVSLECVPYRGTLTPDVWMTSRAPAQTSPAGPGLPKPWRSAT